MTKRGKAVEFEVVPFDPPTRPGLYWVMWPDRGRLIAAVHGTAPFLSVELSDPWEDGPRLKPSAKEIASLIWRGEISEPSPL